MWFWRLSFRLLWATRLYLLWSSAYRWLYHRRYRRVAIEPNLFPPEVASELKKLTWVGDGLREFGDAAGSPHWVQYCLNEVTVGRPQPPGALDCEDFAVWAAACMSEQYVPALLSVSWHGPSILSGHCVCLYEQNRQYWYTGNWGLSGPFGSPAMAMQDTLLRATPQDRQTGSLRPLKPLKLVGWALFTPHLKLLQYGTSGGPIFDVERGWSRS